MIQPGGWMFGNSEKVLGTHGSRVLAEAYSEIDLIDFF